MRCSDPCLRSLLMTAGLERRASHAVITVDPAGASAVPDGSTLIDKNFIFIAGQRTLCTTSRP